MTLVSRHPSPSADAPVRARAVTVILWTAQTMLALFFVVASMPKLADVMPGPYYAQAVEQFDMLGFGDWFRYLTGFCELAGAIGLMLPRLSGLAAMGLAATMAGATIADILVLPNPPQLPIGLLVACAALGWARWPETKTLFRLLRRSRPLPTK